jgi:hypothetical protein
LAFAFIVLHEHSVLTVESPFVFCDLGVLVKADLNEFFNMVVAGLAGRTPHMISATVTGLSRLLFEFKGANPDLCFASPPTSLRKRNYLPLSLFSVVQ